MSYAALAVDRESTEDDGPCALRKRKAKDENPRQVQTRFETNRRVDVRGLGIRVSSCAKSRAVVLIAGKGDKL